MSRLEIIEDLRKLAHSVLPPSADIILFESQARNTASQDSDWDILILLDKERIIKEDYDAVGYPFDLKGWEPDTLVNPFLYTKTNWENAKHTPFYQNVMKEGIAL